MPNFMQLAQQVKAGTLKPATIPDERLRRKVVRTSESMTKQQLDDAVLPATRLKHGPFGQRAAVRTVRSV